MKQLMCESCGSTDLEKQEGNYVCNACGSKIAIEEEKKMNIPKEAYRAITDFSVEEKECLLSVKEWLIQSDYSPDDILVKSKIEPLKKVYIPMYIFSGDYTANWSADSGYYREETYTDYEKRTINGRTVTEPVTKKRTVTDWQPSSGTVTGTFGQFSSANSEIERSLTEHLESMITLTKDYMLLSDFDTEGKNVLPYDMDEVEAFQQIKSRISEQIEDDVRNNIPGDTYKNANWTPSLSHDTTLQLHYPAYVGTYEYDGNTYSFIVDGKNVDNVYGYRPQDENRIEKVKESTKPIEVLAVLNNIFCAFSLILVIATGLTLGFGILVNIGLVVASIFCYRRCIETIRQVSTVQKAKRMRMLSILHDDNLTDDEKEKQLIVCSCTELVLTAEEISKYEQTTNSDSATTNINYKVKEDAFTFMFLSITFPAFFVIFGGFFWFLMLGV